MKIKDANYGEWCYVDDTDVRYRVVIYDDYESNNKVRDYEFSVYKRPYFFGLVGKKKWIETIQTNDLKMGYDFSLTQL